MDLFVVNRYHGENGEVDENQKQGSGMEKLLKQIEERKKLRSQEESEALVNESDHEVQTKHKKKKRKHDVSQNSTSEDLNEVNEDNSFNEVQTKNKKKKRKHDISQNSTSEDLNEVNEDESFNEVQTKKKREKSKLDLSQNSVSELDNDDKVETELKKVKKLKKKKDIDFDGKKVDDGALDSESATFANKENDLTESTKEDGDEFLMIGGHDFKYKKKVKWAVPDWLANPVIMEGTYRDEKAAVECVKGLDQIILSNLERNEIKHFFPVQQAVIPWVLKETNWSGPGLKFRPRDICVCTPTGSGKTLAFVIPIIQQLKSRWTGGIRALVVVPVKDLAIQVCRVFSQYSVGTGLKVLSCIGRGTPLEEEQKTLLCYKAGFGYISLVDILVTTPGRLVEHIKGTPGFSLRQLQFLVIDEADRVIDVIKNDWMTHLENHFSPGGIETNQKHSLDLLYKKVCPQKLLFSATLSQDPEILKQIKLFQPLMFVAQISKSNDANLEGNSFSDQKVGSLPNNITKPLELEEQWVQCSELLKPVVLYHILVTNNWRGVLCFTHFLDAAHQLTRLLFHMGKVNGLDLKIEQISSNIKLADRDKILEGFRAGDVDILVCSDLYSRGLDICEVRYVVQYSIPLHLRNYIHQVGRTARAGKNGTALTLVTDKDLSRFHRMMTKMNSSNLKKVIVQEKDLSYLESSYKDALNALKEECYRDKQNSAKFTKFLKRGKSVIHRTNRVLTAKTKTNDECSGKTKRNRIRRARKGNS